MRDCNAITRSSSFLASPAPLPVFVVEEQRPSLPNLNYLAVSVTIADVHCDLVRP